MIYLYISLGCLLMLAVSVLAMPLIKQSAVPIKSGWVVVLPFCLLTSVLYFLVGGAQQMHQYQTWQQAQQFKAQWGSVEHIIQQLKQHLKAHSDAQGWYLLGKLYLSQRQYAAAAQAFQQGLILKPQDAELQARYHQAKLLSKDE